MEHGHSVEAIRRRLADGPRQSYLRDWVYGGIDGTITAFAIVSGVTGARLAPHVILVLGAASVVADGVAMAAGDYLATRSEDEEWHRAEEIERRHIAANPGGEREEVRQILQKIGIPASMLDQAVASVTLDYESWIRLMLRHEYGLSDARRSPWQAACMTLLSFLACGLIPLAPYAFGLSHAFWVACAATTSVFFSIGALQSLWSTRSWWRAGATTLALGCLAASVAYAVGWFLRGIGT